MFLFLLVACTGVSCVFTVLFLYHNVTELSFAVDVSASQNPSMLTMALRRVARPDDVRAIAFLYLFNISLQHGHFVTFCLIS